ncbi:cation diffusion facilitator family transporter [Fodinicurvata halophila]|uniref:Cation diffusion facilitator family transporter n=1 Tax=Fodinicurvata halophila TaxID=1419723 RepID=A0ABV8UQD6_9PROT
MIAPQRKARLMRWATYASVATAFGLILLKIVAWQVTDSVALLSSLVDSLLDAAASVMTLLAVRQSLIPADADHRFGHGKIESLSALAQAGLVTGSALFLIAEAVSRLVTPQAPEHGVWGISVMLVSIIVTLGLTSFQRQVVRQTGSIAIGADALHYLSDLLMNAAVILALVLAIYLGWTLADPIIALGIAAILLRSAWKIARSALDILMDRELPDSERERILELVRGHSDVLGVHDLKTRSSGQQTFIQLHLEIDGSMTLYRAHAIADTIEAELQTLFPGAEVLIHQDPHILSEEGPIYE